MESRTNSMEDERHYIGNLLDDEGGDISAGKHGGQPNLEVMGNSRNMLKLTQRHFQNNRHGSEFFPALSHHFRSEEGIFRGSNGSYSLCQTAPIGSGVSNVNGFFPRGRKSYRDVASVNRSGSAASSTTAPLRTASSLSKPLSPSFGPYVSCESIKQQRKTSQSRHGHHRRTSNNAPAPITRSKNLSSVSSTSTLENTPPSKPAKILGLNPIDDLSKPKKNALSRKQKSVGDFQRISYKKKNGVLSNLPNGRSDNVFERCVGKPSVGGGGYSVPNTPASYSPPLVETPSKAVANGQLMNGSSRSNENVLAEEDDFVSVAHGKCSATLRNDELNAGKNSDGKSRFDVLKKIGSLSSPNYQNILSALRDSEMESSARIDSEKDHSVSIEELDRGLLGKERDNNKNKHQRDRLKSIDIMHSGSRNVTNRGSFMGILRYFIFCVASVFVGERCFEGIECFNVTTGNSDVISGLESGVFFGRTTNNTNNRRRSRKQQQKTITGMYYLSIAFSTTWKAVRAGFAWIINLLINFIVLSFLAVVVIIRAPIDRYMEMSYRNRKKK